MKWFLRQKGTKQRRQGGWFQRFFYVHPYLEKIPILTIFVFRWGWNHQLEKKILRGILIWFLGSFRPCFANQHFFVDAMVCFIWYLPTRKTNPRRTCRWESWNRDAPTSIFTDWCAVQKKKHMGRQLVDRAQNLCCQWPPTW